MRSDSSIPSTLDLLLVEDHADTRLYLSLLLESFGHRVIAASSVREALIAFFDNEVDVLISDIGLPDGTGWELLRQLQLTRPVHAIAMSGLGTQAERATSQEAGFRRYLVKPFDPVELESALMEAVMELRCSTGQGTGGGWSAAGDHTASRKCQRPPATGSQSIEGRTCTD